MSPLGPIAHNSWSEQVVYRKSCYQIETIALFSVAQWTTCPDINPSETTKKSLTSLTPTTPIRAEATQRENSTGVLLLSKHRQNKARVTESKH